MDLDNLEAAPGRPAPEFQVKTLKVVFYNSTYIFLYINLNFNINDIIYPYSSSLEANWSLLEAAQV